MSEPDVWSALLEAAVASRKAVLATVISTKGSVPRHAGSKMLIDFEQGFVGTIGGGCGEAEVLEAARGVIESGTPRVVRVELTDEIASFSPAVCGGVMEIFLEPVPPAPAS